MEFKHLSLFLNIPLLLIGFFLLNRGAGMLIDGSTSILRKISVPETAINFTAIAFGTSLPKLFTVLLSAYNGYTDLVIGTILGSCIFNLIGVLAIVGLTRPIRTHLTTATIGIATLLFSTVLFYFLANDVLISNRSGINFSRTDGYILLAGFVLFMTYGYFNIKKHHTIWFTDEQPEQHFYPVWFAIILILVGILGLVAGGVLCVNNLIDISQKYHISQKFLGQGILSVGGSFVMLYWIISTKSHSSKFELSNLIGLDMLNLLGMTGATALIMPFAYNKVFNFDVLLFFCITILLLLLLWMGKKLTITKAKAKLLLVVLLLYLVYLFL